MGIFCKGKFSSKAGTVHCIGYKPQVAVWLLTAVSGSGPSPQEVNKSTLQRQKEAFSTKLQHFKIMMARLGFSQVLLLVGSEVDLKQQDSEDKSVLHMQKVMVYAAQGLYLSLRCSIKTQANMKNGSPYSFAFYCVSLTLWYG